VTVNIRVVQVGVWRIGRNGCTAGALGCIRGEVVMDVFLSLLLLLFFAVSCCDYVNCLRRLLLRKQLCSVGGGGALVVVEDKSGETEPPRKTLFSFSLLFPHRLKINTLLQQKHKLSRYQVRFNTTNI
jgi:hypothetical protein